MIHVPLSRCGLITLLGGMLFLAGCEPKESSAAEKEPPETQPGNAPPEKVEVPPSGNANLDSDGDKLADVDEELWGTDPEEADTDGDGFEDGEEVYAKKFEDNWEDYPHKFNPLVADLAEIDIDLRSAPILTMDFTTTDDKVRSFSTGRTDATSKTVTTTNSLEQSWGIESRVEYTTMAQGGSTAFNASESFGWSEAQARENTQTISRAEEFASSNAISKSGGKLAVTVDVINPGNIAYTLKSVTLNAVLRDPHNPEVMIPVGNLIYGKWGTLPSTTLRAQGRGRLEGLVFTCSDLNLDMVKRILHNKSNLVVKISGYELEDSEGPLKLQWTDIGARAAEVSIDYAGKREPETFMVSTYSPDQKGISLRKVLDNILRIKQKQGSFAWKTRSFGQAVVFESEKKGRGLMLIRDFATDQERGSRWVISHEYQSRGEKQHKLYDPFETPYDLDEIMLKSGHKVQFVYLEDADGDGLGARAEFAFGTDPKSEDTDGDGLSDKVEVDGWKVSLGGEQVFIRTNPTRADTDGDGWSDKIEKDRKTDAAQPTLQVEKVLMEGSTGQDRPTEVVVDNEGNVYVCGHLDRFSGSPLFLAKYNSFGDRLWFQKFHNHWEGRDTCGISGMAVGPKGRIFVAISEYVKGKDYERTQKVQIRNRLILRVFNPSGGLIGNTILATPQTEMPRDVVVDPQGNAYVSGTTSGTLSLGTRSKERETQAFLAKFDNSGKLIWVRQFDPRACRHLALSQGKVLVLAGTEGRTDSHRSTLLTLIGYSLDGKELWRKQTLTPAPWSLTDLAIDPSGSPVLVGSTSVSLPGQESAGGNDLVVVKKRANGTSDWMRQFGTAARETPSSVTVGPDGRIYVLGSSDTGDFSQPQRFGLAKQDLFLATYGPTGVQVDVLQVRTEFNEEPAHVTTGPDRKVWITGGATGALKGADFEPLGGADIFLMQLGPKKRRY